MDIKKAEFCRHIGLVCFLSGLILLMLSVWKYDPISGWEYKPYGEPFSQLGQFEPDLEVRSRNGKLGDSTFPTPHRYYKVFGFAFIVISIGIYKIAERLEKQEDT